MLPLVGALINAGLGLLGNAVATKGQEFIEDKVGVKIGNLLGSEEGKIALAKLENEHQEMLQKFAIDRKNQELEVTKLEYQNTSDARDMQKRALDQADLFSKRFIYYFASAWSFAAVLYIGFITFAPIPVANIRFADTILGFILGTIIATIFNFFYGSSKQSKDKDTVIADAVKGMQQ